MTLNNQQLRLLEALNRATGDVDGHIPQATEDLAIALRDAGDHLHTLVPRAVWEEHLGDQYFDLSRRFQYMHEHLGELSITSVSLLGIASLPDRIGTDAVDMRRLQVLATAGALDMSRQSVVFASAEKSYSLSSMGLLLAFPSEWAAQTLESMNATEHMDVPRPWSADQSIREAFDFTVGSGGGQTGYMSSHMGLRRTLHLYDTVDFEVLRHYMGVRDEAANPVLDIAMRLHEKDAAYSPIPTLLKDLDDISRLYPAKSETSLLIQCACDGKAETVLALLDAGHSLRSKDNGGKNPITQAARKDQPEIADLMRAHAARASARNALGELDLKVLAP